MPEFHEAHCTKCDLWLAPEMFTINRARKNGLNVWCKYCMAAYRVAHREQNAVYQREYRKKNPDACRERDKDKYQNRGRFYHIKRRYGLTKDQFQMMLQSQGGVCAICVQSCQTKDHLSVDHDHRTGQVRGLLCHRCNTLLGKSEDNPTILREAALYLERGGFRP